MAINFHPKAGMVLMCDFKGCIEPEINKLRPVVVISPSNMTRPGLCTVVPLSTTAPDPVENYHYKLISNPLGGPECWAKCDLVTTVAIVRLDRVKLGRGKYITANISMDQVREIRSKAALSFGLNITT
jgi:mRNA interferase MazF